MSFSLVGYSSRSSISDSLFTRTSSSQERSQTCKSSPISKIQFSLDGKIPDKNVEETCLDPEFLSHVLSDNKCLVALNTYLENLKINLERIPDNVSVARVVFKEKTLGIEELEEIYKNIQKYCQEHLKKEEHGLEEIKFSFADSKFKMFLDRLENKVSIFFSDTKMSVVGHDEDIACFRDGILTSVLHDEVIRDSMNLGDEQFLYLKTTYSQIKRKFSVDIDLEGTALSETNGSCSAIFRGLKEDVVNAMRGVRQRLETYDKHFWSRQLNKNEDLLLKEKRVIRHLRGEIDRQDCCYLIVEDTSMLYVASVTKKVDSFRSYLENALFVEIKRNLSNMEKTIFLSDEWVKNKYIVLQTNTKKQSIVSVIGNDLVATCVPHVKDQVQIFIEDFLQEKIHLKIIEWKCREDTKQMCLSVKKEELMEMMESRKDELMSISLEDDGVHLQGTDTGIQSCQEMLKSTIDDRKFYRTTFTAASEAVMNHLSNPGAKRKLQEVGKRTRSVINVKSNCKIAIKIGNIANEEVDVIVNSVHKNTTSSVGSSTVAGAIFEKGGSGLQEKLIQKTSGSMQYGEIAVTETSGNLRCKAVYHACLHETPSNQEEEVRKMTKMCLEKAVRDGYTSISFPALGTGVYDYSGAASAKGLFDAIVEFLDTSPLLERIGIVLFQGARRLVEESYRREYGNRRCGESPTALISLTRGCITAGNVTIVAENQQNVDNARKELEDLFRALSTEDQQ
ncbi:uncharacterized protein [Magallana gigas]|uniref:uncharacterized protein isoform X3 n=1 Tax=Magallana gigas TaxID=29159 RepID=UPI00333EBAFA